MSVSPAPATCAAPASAGATVVRRDIQGLRALAVAAVVIYHFWPNRLPGGYVGVDMFFVISGFLITDHLLRKPPTSAKLLAAFWARRVRRLLPAATLVLGVTLVASLVWLPPTQLAQTATEAAASAFYVQNWWLATQTGEYLAASDAMSPLRHYWSLSVEEQFYLLWPLLIAALVLLGRRFGRPAVWLWAGVGAVVAGSLAVSVRMTATDPGVAYYATYVRMWELASGAVVALLLLNVQVPRWVPPWLATAVARPGLRVALAWVGVGLALASMLTFSAQTAFPGWVAALPCVATALVLLANADRWRWSPRVLWGNAGVRWLGDVSYSTYLWHWPVVIIAPYALGQEGLRWPVKLLLITGVLVAAGLTKVGVEDRWRYQQGVVRTLPRSFAFGAACMSMIVAFGAVVVVDARADQARTQALVDQQRAQQCFGAGALRNSACAGLSPELVTTPVFAKEDKAIVWGEDCWNEQPFISRKTCTFGRSDAPVKVALLGNSHAAQWFPALERIAQERGWMLKTYVLPMCFTVPDLPIQFAKPALTDTCQQWNRWALEEIASQDFSVVVMANRSLGHIQGVKPQQQFETVADSYGRVLRRLTRTAGSVLVIRDTPSLKVNVPDCVAAHPGDLQACERPREQALEPDPLTAAATADDSGKVHTVDFNDLMCNPSTCFATAGGVIMYFDDNHLSATYVTSLQAEVNAALDQAMGRNHRA